PKIGAPKQNRLSLINNWPGPLGDGIYNITVNRLSPDVLNISMLALPRPLANWIPQPAPLYPGYNATAGPDGQLYTVSVPFVMSSINLTAVFSYVGTVTADSGAL